MTAGTQVPLVKVGLPPRDSLMPRLEEILYSGMIAEGGPVYEFERRFGRTFGLNVALAMSSGTAALHASLVLSGVKVGDEVISTPMTAEPTNTAILQTGADVVWADVEPDTGNINPASIEALITARTKAIMVVHYAGYPARLAEIQDIAERHGLRVIEDCAHALGASIGGRPIGSTSDFAIFSLQAIKHMTTVDGGVFTTRHADLIDRAREFRWFGLQKGVPRTSADIKSLGYKYNMHNVAATIGLAQLEVIQERIGRHIANGIFFDDMLREVGGVRPAHVPSGSQPSYWLYTLLCEDSREVERLLLSHGVVASKLHKRNDEHSIFAAARRPLPGLDAFYRDLIHIPCGWWVTDEDREAIVEALRRG